MLGQYMCVCVYNLNLFNNVLMITKLLGSDTGSGLWEGGMVLGYMPYLPDPSCQWPLLNVAVP